MGRGISVCSRWDDFSKFLSDMGEKPTPKHTLDRINNDGGYCPENCRWATRSEQRKNSRSATYYTINGESKCLTDWCGIYGMNKNTVKRRMTVHNLPILSALTIPRQTGGGRKKSNVFA